jgi:aminoglycoside 6-adenylyltransferase
MTPIRNGGGTPRSSHVCDDRRMDVPGFLERVTAWATARDDLDAVVLLGSQARVDTPADRWSDVDLLLVVDDPAPFLRDADWLEPLGRPTLTFVEPTAVGGSYERRVLFADGEEVDFAFFAAAAIASVPEAGTVLRRGYRVLVDRIGLGERLAELAAQPAERPQRDLAQLSHDFWYHVLWTAKKLRRGEVWFAWRSCNGYLQTRLVTLLGWRAADRGLDTWHDGRFLEQWVDEETLRRLREAAARYDADDVARALRAVSELFADVENDYAGEAGLAVPVDHDALRSLLRDVLSS